MGPRPENSSSEAGNRSSFWPVARAIVIGYLQSEHQTGTATGAGSQVGRQRYQGHHSAILGDLHFRL